MIRAIFIAGLLISSITSYSQKTDIQYLSGLDKDQTVDWDFKVSGGRNAGEWKTIPVPSNWEMQGFGTYHYWSDWVREHTPDSIGDYRYQFEAPEAWKGQNVKIVFGGAMTDTDVRINGKLAGPKHQGGFYQFDHDISKLIKYGEQNLLEVTVKRFSDNHSINLAERRTDFWMFSGIYRPVWLEIKPKVNIERIAINAGHKGDFSVDVFPVGVRSSDYVIEAQIQDLNGNPVGSSFKEAIKKGEQKTVLTSLIQNVKPWSAEWPNLYQVKVSLKKKDETTHEVVEKFGFRTIEVREKDGVYVNDQKVRLRGVNRHSFWPTSGRTTSKKLSIIDANLIKDMNMNAVRMSHYPPDKHFLEVADSLGLYILDELTGWQDEYDTEVGTKLVKELILRDVNHPSIIFWDNGNEGGWNKELDKEFPKWDPQNRNVLHPWDNFGGINTTHYEVYDCCAETFFHGDDLFMPTEFLHGLYDGGHGAGLEDWWNLMVDNPLAVGGFLWAFADEGIVRDDWDGKIDVDGNHAPDGIVGPYREKEGSFFTIKEVWSQVYIEKSEQDQLSETFNGILTVENRYDHTNLNQLDFSWQLVNFPAPLSDKTNHEVAAQGKVKSPDVSPHLTGELKIDLPEKWQQHDAFYLTATDPYGREIYTWTWMIAKPDKAVKNIVLTQSNEVIGSEEGNFIVLESNGAKAFIDSKTGMLDHVEKDGKRVSLSQGPKMIDNEAVVKEIKHSNEGADYVVKASYEGGLSSVEWRMLPGGWLKLGYSYHIGHHAEVEYIGVSFNYPEDQVTGMQWLGKGPYRVWKNRTKGVEFDVWQKEYNDAVTGLVWEYPEFKGFHSDVYWATLETKEMPITMVFGSEDMYLRLFTPKEGEKEGFDPRTTHVDFPEGDISFLKGIAPIGTKFHTADEHGPAGQLNLSPRHGLHIYDEIHFYFGNF